MGSLGPLLLSVAENPSERSDELKRMEEVLKDKEPSSVSSDDRGPTSGMPYPENLKPIGHPGGGPNWFSPYPCCPCACGSPNHVECSVTVFNNDTFTCSIHDLSKRY